MATQKEINEELSKKFVSKEKFAEEIESLGSFKVEDETFLIAKALKAKCPRCWKFQSHDEESTCKRCTEVLSA